MVHRVCLSSDRGYLVLASASIRWCLDNLRSTTVVALPLIITATNSVVILTPKMNINFKRMYNCLSGCLLTGRHCFYLRKVGFDGLSLPCGGQLAQLHEGGDGKTIAENGLPMGYHIRCIEARRGLLAAPPSMLQVIGEGATLSPQRDRSFLVVHESSTLYFGCSS